MKRNSNRRGLQSVRTLTTRRALPTQQKHELYLKLTTLEMEKTRRQTERNALLKRLHLLEERLAQVIAEQDELNILLANEISSIERPAAVFSKPDDAFPLQY